MAAVGVAVEPSALPLVSASAESDAYDGAGRESVNATPMPSLTPTLSPTPVPTPVSSPAAPGAPIPGMVPPGEAEAEAPPDSGSTTAPAVSGSTTAPAVSGSTTAPAVSGSTTAPADSGSTTAPAVSGSTTAPADSGSTTAPAVSGSTTAPADSGSTTAPAVSGSTTAPAVSGSTTAPADSGSTTAPAVSGSTTAPAVSGSTTAPAVSGSTTAPAESAGGFDRSCIFCKIGNRLEPVDLLHWDEQFACFKDIRPGAPHHYLVVPRRHIGNCKSLKKEHISIVQTMVAIGKNVLLQKGVADPADVRLGFHWPPFCTVAHLHLHVLAPVSQMGFLSRMIYRADSYWFITHEHLIEKLKALPEDCSGS